MDFKGVPLKEKNGDIVGLVCIIEETTERVMTRAKLMQEAKMSVIGRLAAGVAHELNNPLGTLVAYSERAAGLLRSMEGSPPGDPELRRLSSYLTIIEEEAFRCKGVTADILNLFQKDGLEVTEIDVNELLDNTLELMNIEKAHVKIVKEATPFLPRIVGDMSALRQIIVNLITNAMDAVEGRVDPTIWIRTDQDRDHVVIGIEDNGIGIPEELVDKIFEPFFTTKELKNGMGLGLSLCCDLVNDLGGAIRVESKPGFGSTFFVALPSEGKDDKRWVRDDYRSHCGR